MNLRLLEFALRRGRRQRWMCTHLPATIAVTVSVDITVVHIVAVAIVVDTVVVAVVVHVSRWTTAVMG
jgi:hypothetical protein